MTEASLWHAATEQLPVGAKMPEDDSHQHRYLPRRTCNALLAAAAYDVLALAVATTLSVFKPGTAFRSGADTSAAI